MRDTPVALMMPVTPTGAVAHQPRHYFTGRKRAVGSLLLLSFYFASNTVFGSERIL